MCARQATAWKARTPTEEARLDELREQRSSSHTATPYAPLHKGTTYTFSAGSARGAALTPLLAAHNSRGSANATKACGDAPRRFHSASLTPPPLGPA